MIWNWNSAYLPGKRIKGFSPLLANMTHCVILATSSMTFKRLLKKDICTTRFLAPTPAPEHPRQQYSDALPITSDRWASRAPAVE